MNHPPSLGEPTKRRAHLSPSCDNHIYFSVTSDAQARLAFDPSRLLTRITSTATMVESQVANMAGD